MIDKKFPLRLPVYFMVSALYLLVFSWSTSPLYLTYGGDSPFFQIIGLGITQGKVPYVDLFDHKGPVPFFMDALGYSLGLGRTGLFIIQVISFTVTLLLIRRIAGLFTSKGWMTTLLSLIPLAVFITEGNQVEEWQLPYISLNILLIFSHIVNRKTEFPLWKSAVCGACFAAVFLNRPNDGVMWTGSIYFGLLLIFLMQKDFRSIFKSIAAYLAGCLAMAAPIVLWFDSRNALPDLWYGMITHNLIYAGDVTFTWGGIGMIIIPIIITALILITGKEYTRLRHPLAAMAVLTVIFIGKREYYHYLIPIFPIIAVCFALLAEKRKKAVLATLCCLFALGTFTEARFICKAASLRPTLKEFYSQSDRLFSSVPADERNTVWNYNLVEFKGDRWPHLISLMGCFPHAGITPSSPVLAAYDLLWLEDRWGVRTCNPKWLVMCPTDTYNKDFEWIYENYELVAASPSEPVCELRLYKRKQ